MSGRGRLVEGGQDASSRPATTRGVGGVSSSVDFTRPEHVPRETSIRVGSGGAGSSSDGRKSGLRIRRRECTLPLMQQNTADRLRSIPMQRLVAATIPKTGAWEDAQRVAIHARAGYWSARIDSWSPNRPTSKGSRRRTVSPGVRRPPEMVEAPEPIDTRFREPATQTRYGSSAGVAGEPESRP